MNPSSSISEQKNKKNRNILLTTNKIGGLITTKDIQIKAFEIRTEWGNKNW